MFAVPYSMRVCTTVLQAQLTASQVKTIALMMSIFKKDIMEETHQLPPSTHD